MNKDPNVNVRLQCSQKKAKEKNLHDLSLSYLFFVKASKVCLVKENDNWASSKLKIFALRKTLLREKREAKENIFSVFVEGQCVRQLNDISPLKLH